MSKRAFFKFRGQSTDSGISTSRRTIYVRKIVFVLLIFLVPGIIGVCAAESLYKVRDVPSGLMQAREYAGEARGLAGNEEHRRKIRKENDEKSKAREPLYPQQAASLAKQYKETAAMVARQGGDPQPLLDAAAYFERQSK